jgi:hypothetical protein
MEKMDPTYVASILSGTLATFQYELVERSAGVIEDITITEDIGITSTTTSLSIFSQ